MQTEGAPQLPGPANFMRMLFERPADSAEDNANNEDDDVEDNAGYGYENAGDDGDDNYEDYRI
jgi:hypothetical protein